jgi:hypothetical protein
MAGIEDADPTHAASEVAEVIQKDVKRKWTSYIWDTFDKSPEERRLLFKLDAALLSFASLGRLSSEWFVDIRSKKIHSHSFHLSRLFYQIP